MECQIKTRAQKKKKATFTTLKNGTSRTEEGMRATLKCADVFSCCADGFYRGKWTEKERLTQDRLDKHKIHNSDRSVGLKDKERTHLFASEKAGGACFMF